MIKTPFQPISRIKLIPVFEISGFYFFVGLRCIVKLSKDLVLVEHLPMERSLLLRFNLDSAEQVNSTDKFYRRLLEMGNEKIASDNAPTDAM